MLTKISSFTKSLFTIRRGFLPLAFIVCLLGAGGFAAYPVYSSRLATFTVTNTNDSGAGSLRQAILDANATVADDTITFNIADCPSGVCTITLSSGELVINAASTAGKLTIANSTGASNLLISGNNQSRVFYVKGNGNLTLDGVTVTGGNGTGTSSSGFGGGIFNNGGTVTLTNSAVSGNTGTSGGGGIYNSFAFGTTILTNSTVSGNTANGIGGGGIYSSGTMTLTNSIVSGNTGLVVGGIANDGAANLKNTIVAGNTAANASSPDFSGAVEATSSHNLIGNGTDTTGITNGMNNNQVGTNANPIDARLAPLGNYGGSTQTHALLSNSPAINTGSDCVINLTCPSNNPPAALTTDQRGAGFPRKVGSAVDIGAFEAQTTPDPLSLLVTRSDDRDNATCVAGDCSLREAVKAANASATNDTISFAVGISTITLTNEIVITNTGTLSINGGGANVLTIDGGAGANRIFSTLTANVTITGVTLTGGNGAGANGSGFGNAIYVDGGTLVLESVVVRANVGTSKGSGAVFFFRSGTNHRIANSTFSDNRDKSCSGFRIDTGTLAVINSTFSGNQATDGVGGGFCVLGGDVTMRNSTVTGNSAGGPDSNGGGIYVCGCVNGGGPFNIGNTIVAGNTSSTGISPEIAFSSGGYGGGTFTSAGYNLIGDSAGDSTNTGTAITYQATDIQNMNPNLGALTIANGGTTPTHALLAGSPAIDAGFNALAAGAGLTTDQRGAGFPRIVDGNGDTVATVDIGSYEYQSNNGGSNTPTGSSVIVQSAANDATVNFTQVGNAGTTTFTPISPPSSAGTPPQGYTIPNNEPAYDITTTASYTPPVTVCFRVSSINDQAEFARVRILHGEGGQLVDRTILQPNSPAPDFATRTVCARVNSLSPFVAALAPTASTAASVSVGGRVMTMKGKGIRDVVVTMTDSTGNVRTTTTNEFGYYRFDDVEVGETYILSVRGKRFTFIQPSLVLNVSEDCTDINFIGRSSGFLR